MAQHLKIIYGAFPLALLPGEEVKKIISLCKEAGIKELDTARIYPGSEKFLGESGAAKDFIIDTKARAWVPGCLSKEGIFESIDESFKELKVQSVEVFYLHCPDESTPFEETVDAIDELYKQGKFKAFGLSNFVPEAVKEIYEYAKKNNYVLPTVYQGNYNAFSRKIEKDLFPVLRDLNIKFYAYSPIAGGFLVKSVKQVEDGEGRFEDKTMVGKLYSKLYKKPLLLKGLEKWNEVAEKNNISKPHMAYRWIAFHSALKTEYDDAIIIGGKNHDQVSDTLNAFKEGPLPNSVVAEIENIWQSIKDEAPLDNFHTQ